MTKNLKSKLKQITYGSYEERADYLDLHKQKQLIKKTKTKSKWK